MTVVVTEAVLDEGGAARVAHPRNGYLSEQPDGDGFVAVRGPWHQYRRTVELRPAGDAIRVRQTVDYELAVPWFGFLFALPFRSLLGQLEPKINAPWWAPPDALDPRSAGTLAALALLSIVTGYLGTLLTETATYAADEFKAGTSGQGVALAVVRASVLIALPLVTAADRLGRRRVLLWALAAGCGLTALGSLAPTLGALAGLQLFARGGASAAIVLIGVITAEEMPAGSRAYAVSLLTMAGALGAGIGVMSLPLTGLGVRAWRLLFLAALAGVLILRPVARRLPESRRFVVVHAKATMRGHGGRLALLAGSSFLLLLWATPAGQFTNEFLRTERHFSATRIAAFTVGTYTPASIGIAAGGRLADVHGRRLIGSIGLVLGTIGGVVMFFVRGWPLWVWSLAGNTAAALTVPALAVYGPELFPTALRGRANGVINVVGAAGGAAGLVVVGRLASHRYFGTLGTPLAILGAGPIALAVLVLARYPETAHRELEDLNPEDSTPLL